MLLRFTVENFLCFRDEATLSLLASNDERHPEHVIEGPDGLRLLKVAAVYGANGHGKTKLFDAIHFIERMVVSAAHEDGLPTAQPFRFAQASRSRPSRFVLEFRAGEKNYEFGLVVDAAGIKEEWLYSRRGNRDTLIFERTEEDRSGDSSGVKFGKPLLNSKSPSSKFKMQDYLEFLATSLEADKIFLVEGARRGIEPLDEPLEWFMKNIFVVSATATYGNLHTRALTDEKFLPFLSSFVNEADIGIRSLSVERNKLSRPVLEQMIESNGPEFRRSVESLSDSEQVFLGGADGPELVIERDASGDYYSVGLVAEHNGPDGTAKLDLSEESSGTRRLLDLLPMMSGEKDGIVTYVVDELDRKLHPLLAFKFVEAFVKCPNVQIIFTTHNTQLLDLDLLRRDEIWFVQKKVDQSVELYSLADFKIRPDLDVRKGYLQGRFGAIPFLGNVNDLGWCSDQPSGELSQTSHAEQ